MLNVLLNAYAVSPLWGSEQGMGWNWVTNIGRYCHVDVITEGEWRDDIERALQSIDHKDNITFHYLPVSHEVRRMCWNQGDWRFYWHYRRWQKRALAKAREICSAKRIDIVHQLNMIGFREPGFLWKIKDIPFVWGPIGGMDLMPEAYLVDAPLNQRLFNKLKNRINKFQYLHSSRVRKTITRSSALISAVKGVEDVLRNVYHRDSILINETGIDSAHGNIKRADNRDGKFKVLWVGKFDFRKQLPLAMKAIAATNNDDIEFHICGTGSDSTVLEMKTLARELGINSQCHWHGNVPHDEIGGLMTYAHLFLFTSIMDATSTVVLEAIAAGLPVLCFNTCGFGPIVNDFAGITIELSNPTKSITDFAIEINRLYNNRNLIVEISQKINTKRDSLTWDSKARQTVDIYRSLMFGN